MIISGDVSGGNGGGGGMETVSAAVIVGTGLE